MARNVPSLFRKTGSHSLPDITDHIFAPDGDPVDVETYLQEEALGNDAFASLAQLPKRIADLLQSHRIIVIPDPEVRKTLPWLTPGEDAMLESATMGKPIIVRDAFFFILP